MECTVPFHLHEEFENELDHAGIPFESATYAYNDVVYVIEEEFYTDASDILRDLI